MLVFFKVFYLMNLESLIKIIFMINVTYKERYIDEDIYEYF